MFSCQSFISKSSREEICDTPSLLSFLEQTDRISEEDVTFLEEMMDMLDNHELVRLVKLYKGSASSLPTTSHGQEININIGQAAQHQFLPSGGNPYNLPGPHITPSTSKEPLLSPAHFMNSSSLCTFGNKPLEQPGSATKQYIGGTAAEPDARVSSAAGARQPGKQ
ncbi:uncharacterized protein LOC102808132, partial [Saccoglossus kowalevskii]|uniref:Uncharacterized protein LOC102808132 n=1 Tax=Saccoglossus kowalevskii TaxID=10224 RepID=A0ABM0M3P0_SACKO